MKHVRLVVAVLFILGVQALPAAVPVPTIIVTFDSGTAVYPTPIEGSSDIDDLIYSISFAENPTDAFAGWFYRDTDIGPTISTSGSVGWGTASDDINSVTFTVTAFNPGDYIYIYFSHYSQPLPEGAHENILILANEQLTPVATYELPVIIWTSTPTPTPTPTITITATQTPTVSPTVTITPHFNLDLSADRYSVVVGETIKISVVWSIDGQSAYGWRLFSDGNGVTNFGSLTTAVPTPIAANTDITRPGLGWLVGENLYNPAGTYEYYYAVTETTVSTEDFIVSAFFYIDDVVIGQKFINLGPVVTQTITPTVTPTVTVTPGAAVWSYMNEVQLVTTVDTTTGIKHVSWPRKKSWRLDETEYVVHLQPLYDIINGYMLPTNVHYRIRNKAFNSFEIMIIDDRTDELVDCSVTPITFTVFIRYQLKSSR